MAASEGITWSASSATVNVGETVTVNVTYGMAPTSAEITNRLNGLATAEFTGSEVVFTGVSAGSVLVPTGANVGNGTTTMNDFTLTVTGGDDQNFLNERGLAHFWENIDAIKQDALVAGDHIDITSDVISATGYVHSENPQAAAAASSTITGSMIANGTITADKLAPGATVQLTLSTSDIGEGSPLAANTLYGVYR